MGTEGPEATPNRGFAGLRTLAGAAALGTLLGFLASLGISAFSGAGTRAPMEIRWVIPAGASELIARGENPLELPASLRFVEGDVLVVENGDTSPHTVGPFRVEAGSTGRWVLGRATSGVLTCTLHPSRRLDLRVEPRGPDLKYAALLGTSLGAPLGLLGLGLWRYLAKAPALPRG